MWSSIKRILSAAARMRWLRWIAALAGLILLLLPALYGLLYTEWFQELVRRRVFAEVRTMTGCRVESAGFRFDPRRLRFTIQSLAVAADSSEDAEAFLTIRVLEAELGIRSIFGGGVSLHSMKLDAPRLRVSVNAAGEWNLPSTREQAVALASGAGDGFALNVGEFELRDGTLEWNDESYEISFFSRQFEVRAKFEPDSDRHRIEVHLGQSWLETPGHAPLSLEGHAEAFLYRDRLEVPAISLSSGETKISGRLTVEPFGDPRVEMTYQVSAPLRAWAGRLEWPGLAHGLIEVEGEAHWDNATGDLGYSGNIQAADLFAPNHLSGEPTVVRAAYEGGQDELLLRSIVSETLGGKLSGEASVANPFASDARRFRVRLGFEEFPLAPIAEMLLASSQPRVRFPWTGLVNGTFEAEGSKPADLNVSASVTVSEPKMDLVHRERLPISGAAELHYDGARRMLTVSRLEALTGPNQVHISGVLALEGQTQLSIRANVADLEQLRRAAELWRGEPVKLPLDLRGQTSLRGRLTGRISPANPDWKFSGAVSADEFLLRGQHWKQVRADVELTPNGLRLRRGRLDDDDGFAEFSLTADFSPLAIASFGPELLAGKLVSESTGTLKLHDLSVAKLLKLSGHDEPITGKLRGELDFSGPAAQLRGSARLEILNGSAWGENFDRLSASVRLGATEIRFESVELARKRGRLRLDAVLGRNDGSFRFKAGGNNWYLEELGSSGGEENIPSGELKFELQGTGRRGSGSDFVDDFSFTGSAELSELKLAGKDLGSFSANLRTEEGEVHLRWLGNLLSGKIEGRATVQPSRNGSFSGECKVTDLDLIHLAYLADLELAKMTGVVDGRFSFSGELARIGDLEASGELTRLELDYSEIPGANRGYQLWNPFPMRWNVAGRKLRIDHMRLLGDGTDLELDGTVGFDGGFAKAADSLDLTLAGIFNLAVLESFRPGIQARGRSELEATIGGNAARPTLRGQMEIKDGSLRYEGIANGLSNLSGRLRFNERLVRIEEVRAASGGGNLRVTGTARFEQNRWNYRLDADVEHVRIRYPESVSSVVDGRFTYSGTNLQSFLDGEVVVSRVNLAANVSLGGLITSLAEPTQTPASNPALANLHLELRVTSAPGLMLDTQLIRGVEVQMNLRLAGTAVNPSLLGDIKIIRGELLLEGSRYTINRGDIEFYNPFRVEPVVDIEFETRIRDVDIALTLAGPANSLQVSYRSDPPLREDELISLIAMSRSPTTDPVLASQQALDQQAFIQAGASAIFAKAVSSPGSRRLSRFFGVSRLKVDPRIGGAESTSSARISTEQQVTRDLTFIYSYDLSSAQRQVVRVEWAPTRRWSLIVTRDENGLVGADVLFKKRLR